MIHIETQYLNLSKILLLAIGLWPYQQSKLVRLQSLLCFTVLTSFIIFQLAALITTDCTPEFTIKLFSITMFFCCFAIEFNSFWVNIHNVKYVLEQLQNICNELKDENEIAIIQKYGNIAKCIITITFVAFVLTCTFIAISLPIWPQIFNINESQLRQTTYIVTEYFIDQEKYFYLISLHTNVAVFIGSTALTGTGTMLLGYVIYICGLFRIASYRMEQVLTTKVPKNITLENQIMICKDIIDAVKIHRKAIKFSNFLSSSFEGSYFLLVIIGVICLSLNIFEIFQNVLIKDIRALLLHFLLTSIMFAYMFVASYAGQEITNHYNHLYFKAYNSHWYNAPLHVQKLILFILIRSSKNLYLNIGGIIMASLECFSVLTKAAMSYFTFMYSMQE